VVQTVNDYLMPALVAAFAAQYPDIRLYVDELPSDEVEARLENGRLQVGLSFLPATQGGIEASPLLEERLVLIARDDHILAAESDVAVESLDGMPLVMLANTFCTRRLWEENARLAGAQPQVVMEMNTVSSILAVVEKTGLATVLPALTLADERLSHLRRIPLSKPTPMRTVGIMWPKERYMCSASRTFIDTAKKVVEGLGE
ncbi:MAG: LysR family transcriptional regulator substrate-binding protein, partial [Chloroflexota bacterium]